MNGIYIYKEIIVQIFVIPAIPARKEFSSNFFVSLPLLSPVLMVETDKKKFRILKTVFLGRWKIFTRCNFDTKVELHHDVDGIDY